MKSKLNTDWIDNFIQENKSQIDNLRKAREICDWKVKDSNHHQENINNLMKYDSINMNEYSFSNEKEGFLEENSGNRVNQILNKYNHLPYTNNHSNNHINSYTNTSFSSINHINNINQHQKDEKINESNKPNQIISESAKEILIKYKETEKKDLLITINNQLKHEDRESQTEFIQTCGDCPELTIKNQNLLSENLLLKEEIKELTKLKERLNDTQTQLEKKEKEEIYLSSKISILEEKNEVLKEKTSQYEKIIDDKSNEINLLNQKRIDLETLYDTYKKDASEAINYLSSKLDEEFSNLQSCLLTVNDFADSVFDDLIIKKSKRRVGLIGVQNSSESFKYIESILRRRVFKLKEVIIKLRNGNGKDEKEGKNNMNYCHVNKERRDLKEGKEGKRDDKHNKNNIEYNNKSALKNKEKDKKINNENNINSKNTLIDYKSTDNNINNKKNEYIDYKTKNSLSKDKENTYSQLYYDYSDKNKFNSEISPLQPQSNLSIPTQQQVKSNQYPFSYQNESYKRSNFSNDNEDTSFSISTSSDKGKSVFENNLYHGNRVYYSNQPSSQGQVQGLIYKQRKENTIEDNRSNINISKNNKHSNDNEYSNVNTLTSNHIENEEYKNYYVFPSHAKSKLKNEENEKERLGLVNKENKENKGKSYLLYKKDIRNNNIKEVKDKKKVDSKSKSNSVTPNKRK